MDSLDLLGFFVEHFEINDIYKYGWIAARDWMILISGILVVISLSIRWTEEQVTLFTTGKNKMTEAMYTVAAIAISISIFFIIVSLILDFFNAIYGAIGRNNNLMLLGKQLDSLMSKVMSKEYEFDFSEVIYGAYFIFAMVIYAVTYGVLVFVIISLRIAHALLVTFVVFWAAVALPMSISTSLKMLSPLKDISLIALFWPIIDGFFLFLISSVFNEALESAGNKVNAMETWDLSVMLFYLGVFSIINLILVATTVSAPFIAQGLANGTGNVTGMIGSFAAAGIGAGMIAGKAMTKGLETATNRSVDGIRTGVNNLGSRLNNMNTPRSSNFSTPKIGEYASDIKNPLSKSTPSNSSTQLDTAKGADTNSSKTTPSSSNEPLDTAKGADTSSNKTTPSSSNEPLDTAKGTDTSSSKTTPSSSNEPLDKVKGTDTSSNKTTPSTAKKSISNMSNMSMEQQIESNNLDTVENSPSSNDNFKKEQERIKKQAKRGAIMNLKKQGRFK